MNRLPLLLCAVGAACASHREADLQGLRPGRFVEAKGVLVDGAPVVRAVAEVPRSADDKADKVEITATVERADAAAVQALGRAFTIDADTEYEDAQKQTVAPFTPVVGDWLRLKARSRNDELRARTLRQADPRGEWKVTGEVREVDSERNHIDLGGLVLPLAQDVAVTLTGKRDPNDPLSLFLADDQKAVPFSLRVGDSLRFGGQASANLEWNDEFDLDEADDGDRTKPEYKGKVDALWLFDEHGSYALGEVSFGRNETWREGGDDTHDNVLELTRGFVSLRANDHVQLIAGRQDFAEEREWLYDEVLDGARVVARFGDFECEVGGAVGRELFAEGNEFEDTGLWLGQLRWYLDAEWMLSGYLLQRTDATAAAFEPTLYGVRSICRPRYGFGHWLELGGAGGEVGDQDVRGYAFDLGAIYTFDTPGRPSLGVGYAFANGRADDSATLGYRQTGLQDNNEKLGGVTSVRYYGELFDPELSNLAVATVVAAIRPLPGFSVSVLAHSYQQDVAAANAADTGLRTSPTGGSRELGRELDVVFGYRFERRLTLELVGGHFVPGEAFADQDPANLLEFTARFSF